MRQCGVGEPIECFMCGASSEAAGPVLPSADDAFICQACQAEQDQLDILTDRAVRTTPCTVCGRLLRPDESYRVEVSEGGQPQVWCAEHSEQREREVHEQVEASRKSFWSPNAANDLDEQWEYLFVKQSHDESAGEFRIHGVEPAHLAPADIVPGMSFEAGWRVLLREGWRPDRFAFGLPRNGDDDPGHGAFRLRRPVPS